MANGNHKILCRLSRIEIIDSTGQVVFSVRMVIGKKQTALLSVPFGMLSFIAFLLSVLAMPLGAQSSSADDMVIYVEAENTTSRSESFFSKWVNGSAVPGYSGSGYVQLSTKPFSPSGALITPGTSEPEATPLSLNVQARALMRSSSDQHYWSFVAPVYGLYTFRIIQRPRDYVSTFYSPNGNGYSVYGSGNKEDIIYVPNLQAGQRYYFSVAVGSGGYSESEPYTVVVSPYGYGARLKYTVNFPEAGEYSIFLRGFAKQGREIPIIVDVNGSPALYKRFPDQPASSGWLVGTPPQDLDLSDPALARRSGAQIAPIHYEDWFWHASRLGSGGGFRCYIWVPAPGTYELGIGVDENWTSEDSFLLDKICLSRNPNFSPYFTNDFWEKQSIYQIITDRFYDGDPSNNNATDGTVLVEPNPPLAGQNVKITFLPSARNLGSAQQVNLYRGHNGWTQVVSQPMTKSGSVWTASFAVPTGAEVLNFVFNDGGNIWDNNGYANWNVPVGVPSVTTSPDPPVAGKPVTITYNPAGRILSASSAIAIHLGYNDWGQDVSSRPMTSLGNGSWSYTYEVPAAATNLTFVFNNTLDVWDSNGGRDWRPSVLTSDQLATRRQGGDFKGIEMKLDYIKAMGFSAIWMSPVLMNGKGDYHGYAATDFYRIDPRFGTLEDLRRLIREAHKRGILVINDVVVNHGSTLFSSAEPGWPAFRAQGYALTNTAGGPAYAPPFDAASIQQAFGNANPANIFNNYGSTSDWNDPLQVMRGSLLGLDDFRTESPYVRQKMKEIYAHWIREVGFDGFRIDTAKHAEMAFWNDWCPAMRREARAVGQDNFFQFGEVYSGSEWECGSYTQGQRMDSVADYPLYYKIDSAFARGGSTSQLAGRFSLSNGAPYSASAANRLVTFVDNHDVPRFLSPEAGGDTQGLEMALAYLFAAPGIPTVYYGTEQDFRGGKDPANRESMFEIDKFDMTAPRFKLITQLNYLRRMNFRPWLPLGDGEVSAGSREPRKFAALQSEPDRGLFVASSWIYPHVPYYNYPQPYELILLLNTSDSEKTTADLRNWRSQIGASTNYSFVSAFGSQETFSFAPTTIPPRSFRIFVSPGSSFLAGGLPPSVDRVTPPNGSLNISRSGAIKINFDKPMDKASVEAAFATTPPTQGTFAWSSDSKEMIFLPSAPLQSDTVYQVVIGKTASDASGQIWTQEPRPWDPVSRWYGRCNQPLIYDAPFVSSFTTGSSAVQSAPTAGSASARDVSAASAKLSGSVGAGGTATIAWFEYGPTSSYGSSTPQQPAGSGYSSTEFSGTVAGLQSGTTYNCRLVASNSLGVTYGPNSTFRTTALFASATTGQFSNLSVSSVSLVGSFSLQGPSTTCFFEYGFDADRLINSTPPVIAGPEQPSGDSLAQLNELLPDTTYFYRLVTVAGTATNRGALQSFRTLPVKPTFAGLAVGNFETNSAAVTAVVSPNGSDSQAWFEYSVDGTNWLSSPAQAVAASNTNGLALSANFANLSAGQSYFYRGVASNTNGVTYSDAGAFSAARLKPEATTGAAQAPAAGTLQLAGSVNPNGTASGYWIEYGPIVAAEASVKTASVPYQSSTRRIASDDAESYQALGYSSPDNNGGSGWGVFTDPYGGTQVGGLTLVTNNRRIDGAKSFAVSAGAEWGAHVGYRPVADTEQFGVFTASLRFDVDNTAAFSGLNLKSATSAEFQVAELISVGMTPFDGVVGGNSQLVVSDINGRRGIEFGQGADLRREILDIKIEYDCKTGDCVVGAKRRSETSFRNIASKLKSSGPNVKVAALGYLNANGSGSSGQNLIFDNLQLTTFTSVGNSAGASDVSVNLSGLSLGETYTYRLVAYGLSGVAYGASASGVAGQQLSGIAAWRKKWFGTTNNAGISADTHDYAGDGVKNIVKYAFGLDPSQPVGNGGVVFSEEPNGLLSVTFDRNRDASDIVYKVEATGNLLSGWSEIWSSSTNAYPGGTNPVFSQRVTDVLPAESSPTGQRFIRLNITGP